MAQTEKGQKFIRVPACTRSYHGKAITVPAHVRSTPIHYYRRRKGSGGRGEAIIIILKLLSS